MVVLPDVKIVVMVVLGDVLLVVKEVVIQDAIMDAVILANTHAAILARGHVLEGVLGLLMHNLFNNRL